MVYDTMVAQCPTLPKDENGENVNREAYPENEELVRQLTSQLNAGWRNAPR